MSDEELKALADRFRQKLALDPEIRSLSKKIADGTADFSDTSKLFWRRSVMLREYTQDTVLDLAPEDRQRLVEALLHRGYDDTTEALTIVQETLDKAQGLHLNPVVPKYPAERVVQVAHALMDPTVPDEKIVRRAGAPVANVNMSFHDDYMKENAKIRAKLGFKCYLNRVAAAGCCKWCTDIAGRYVYGDQPEDVFRRHDNCGCTVTFENGRERQDVWSKRTWQASPLEVMRAGFKPVRNSRAQAENLQEIMMRDLTMPGNESIIEDRRTGIILNTKLYHGEVVFRKITDERIEHIVPLRIDTLSPENNQKLTKGCKDILNYMRDENLGREGAIVFDMNMSEIDRFMSEKVASSVPAKTYSESCIVLHNHPSDTLLSDEDLFRFYEHDEYKILGAIGHNGSTYFVEKTNEYDALGFYDHMKDCMLEMPISPTDSDRVKLVERIMEGAGEYGVRFYTEIYS